MKENFLEIFEELRVRERGSVVVGRREKEMWCVRIMRLDLGVG